ncbi:hypothetical protein PInf_023598 [Phytophthora infestans]|nr:hypothetical protein PInf_023598 [Phytophthora infestans]
MSSSPAVKYARYKRATAFFLDWLLRARGGGRHAGQRVQLEALNDVVKEIAADPSTLTPKLLQQLPKALAACQYAITLREHLVHLFMELDELLEGVYKVYSGVKQEKRSLVEATVVVKLAMDTASALTARLQPRYPSLRSA